MTWVERNQKQIEKIRAYILDFQNIKPGLFAFFQGGTDPIFPLPPESDRGVALLLFYCALYQNISEAKLISVLSGLWNHYGKDVFRLNKLPFEELQNFFLKNSRLFDWPLRTKAAGILRSACDFFFHHGKILPWISAQENSEACVRILADEIFLMGKTSALQTKPRYFIWLMTQLPGSRKDLIWTDSALVPMSYGQVRFLREFGPLKGKRNSPWTTPQEKLDYFNRFYKMLFPNQSWMVYSALDAYLEPSAEAQWRCREIVGKCHDCALAAECPGREDEFGMMQK